LALFLIKFITFAFTDVISYFVCCCGGQIYDPNSALISATRFCSEALSKYFLLLGLQTNFNYPKKIEESYNSSYILMPGDVSVNIFPVFRKVDLKLPEINPDLPRIWNQIQSALL